MTRKLIQISFSILLLAGMLLGFAIKDGALANSLLSPVKQGNPESKIESELINQLNAGPADFIVVMAEQADVSAANQLQTKVEKGQFVFDQLVTTATRTQAELLAYLEDQGVDYQSYYIFNGILVKQGSLNLAQEIASLPEVAAINLNHSFQLEEPMINPDAPNQPSAVESNISFVKADQVWAMGYTGQGTTVAGNDTGLYWNHPALVRQYRGCVNPPSCTTVDHNFNWWDATGTYPTEPNDGHGHGTHTTGTMVGDDGSANQIGMAPGARTVHCKNMDNGGGGQDAWFLTCFQWDLAPWDLSGSNPTPALAPDSINNSWGYWGGGNNVFRTAIQNLHAAGIIVEVSAGNEGSACTTLRSPGDYIEVFTTGSVNHANAWPGTMTGFSSRGPSILDGNYFPDFTAPGENIRSSIPGGGYQGGWSGTSMSGPHVTALIGLIWSANPSLKGQIQTTYDIIQQTSAPVTSYVGSCGGDYVTGPNNDWGYGTIDALAAVNLAISYGGAGTLQGTVVDSVTLAPVAGATVQAVRQAGGSWTGTTNSSGFYQLAVAAGTFDITASHEHYMAATVNNVVVLEDSTTVQDFSLTSRGWAYGYVYDFDNPTTGIADATVSAEDGSTTLTDATGYYELWLDPGVHTLTASATDYAPESAVITIASGIGTPQNFYLQAAVVFIPSPIDVSVPLGSTFSQAGTILNRQPWVYDFVFNERDHGYLPMLGNGTPGTQAPIVPVGSPVVQEGASNNDSVQPFSPRINQNTIAVVTSTNVYYSVEQALIQLGYTYDLIYGPPWTGINFTPYDIVFVAMDGGLAETTDVQALRTQVLDQGKKLVVLGGTCYQPFAMGMNQYIVQNNVNDYCWQITGSPNWTVIDTAHPLANGLPTSYNYANSSAGYYSIRVNDPDIENVAVNAENWPTLFRKTTNGDFIWYIDSVYDSYWTNPTDFAFLKQIISNAIESGGADVPWLSTVPMSGTVPADGSLGVSVNFDATPGAGVTQPGTYYADLIVNGTPKVTIPVSMHVEAPANWGRLDGTVSGLGYCDTNPSPLEGAMVEIVGIGTLETDAAGYFATYLEQGTYTLIVSANGHIQAQGTVVVVAQSNTTANFDLRWDKPCLTAAPPSMSVTLDMGASTTLPMTLTNTGAGTGTFDMSDLESGYTPMRQGFLPTAVRPNIPDDTPTSIGRAPEASQASPDMLGKFVAQFVGEPAFAVDVYPGYNLVTFLNDNPGAWTVVAGLPGNQYFAGDFINGDYSTLYVIDYGTSSLYAVDTVTGVPTLIGPSTPFGGESWTGMTGSTDGTMYASSTNISRSTLYTVDLSSGAVTVVGEVTNAPAIIDIAITPDGNMYGVDIVNDNLVQIDPSTGAGTVIGYIGFNANYAQGMDYEETSGTLYLAAYGTSGELRIADPATGNSTLVGGFPSGAEVDALAFATGGGGDAAWLSENPASGTIPGTLNNLAAQNLSDFSGIQVVNPGLTTSSPEPEAIVIPESPSNPEDVLWNQPLSSVNQNAYVNQDFSDLPSYSSFLADDFTSTDPWSISSIFVPGNGWNGFATLFNASGLTWQIYADNGGVPAGNPVNGGALWSITLPPSDAQVVITNGSGGLPSNTTLNLNTPVDLPPGHYWFVFYPTMPFSGGGQFGRQPADTVNGYVGQFINPGGSFGFGTNWQSWAIIGATQNDIAFRIEGTIGSSSNSQVVDVTFDAGMVTQPGTYTGQVKAATNDPVVKNYAVDVTMVVNAPADWGQLAGTVTGLGYCDVNPGPLQGAEISIVGGLTVETDATGYYLLWLAQGTYDVVVSKDGHTVGTATVVVTGQQMTVQNFDLRLLQPCLSAGPDSLTVTLDLGEAVTETLTLTNMGAAEGTFTASDSDQGYTPKLAHKPVRVTLKASPNTAPADTAVAVGEYQPRSATTVSVKPNHSINQSEVLLLNADDDNTMGSPIRDMLIAYGDLDLVDMFDARYATPTLDQLSAYSVVVVWANYVFADAAGIGNVLADYVDSGGKVIDLNFGIDPNWGYQGRFRTQGYSAMTTTGTGFSTSCLGTFDPSHPIMDGVTDVCDYYRGSGTSLTPGSSEVAQWQDGNIFIAVKDDGSVATIGGYVGFYYMWTGQMADVLHNAILWTAGGGDAIWLTEDPLTGTVSPDGGTQDIDVIFDASMVTQPGTYLAEINVKTNDPVNNRFTIPATMNVNGPLDWGRIEGDVSSLGYCDANPSTLAGATVEIVGFTTLTTDDLGHFSTWLPEGTYTVNVTADGQVSGTATVVVTAQQTTVQDFGLRSIVPCMEVTPTALEATLATDSQTTQLLSLVNTGAGDATFKITEMLGALGLANISAGNVTLSIEPTGIQPGLTASSPETVIVPVVPAANPDAVLWDQPLSYVNQNAYVNQDFSDFTDYSSFLADDFVNADAWEISTIFVPGNGWNGFSTLMNASSLTWQIYADNNGVPAGDPASGGAVWSITLPPTDPQVVITNGSGGMPSNATLNLTDPLVLEDGHWWLVFYPTMPFSGGGQYGRQAADTMNNYIGQFINPGGAFGFGTVWTNWTVLGPTQQDIAFRLEGELASIDIPWLSENPTQGTVPADTTLNVVVTFDSTGLSIGDYTGTLKVKTGDPNNATVNIPVTLHVVAPVAPVVSFTSNTPVVVGEEVVFTNTSNPGSPPTTEYLWDFGDGVTMTVPTADPVMHIYTSTGTFTVTLEACNAAGCDTFSANVVILPKSFFLSLVIRN